MKIKDAFVIKITTFMALVAVLLGGVTIVPEQVFSLGGGVHPSSGLSHQGVPFGGPIQKVKKCTCFEEQLITIYDYATHSQKKILYSPLKSKMYDFFAKNKTFTVGQYVLGTYDIFAICYKRTQQGCQVDEIADGVMNRGPGTGTSGPLSGSSGGGQTQAANEGVTTNTTQNNSFTGVNSTAKTGSINNTGNTGSAGSFNFTNTGSTANTGSITNTGNTGSAGSFNFTGGGSASASGGTGAGASQSISAPNSNTGGGFDSIPGVSNFTQ